MSVFGDDYDDYMLDLGKNRTWKQWIVWAGAEWLATIGIRILLYISLAYWLFLLNQFGVIKL